MQINDILQKYSGGVLVTTTADGITSEQPLNKETFGFSLNYWERLTFGNKTEVVIKKSGEADYIVKKGDYLKKVENDKLQRENEELKQKLALYESKEVKHDPIEPQVVAPESTESTKKK